MLVSKVRFTGKRARREILAAQTAASQVSLLRPPSAIRRNFRQALPSGTCFVRQRQSQGEHLGSEAGRGHGNRCWPLRGRGDLARARGRLGAATPLGGAVVPCLLARRPAPQSNRRHQHQPPGPHTLTLRPPPPGVNWCGPSLCPRAVPAGSPPRRRPDRANGLRPSSPRAAPLGRW
jgi:hypothetical protein